MMPIVRWLVCSAALCAGAAAAQSAPTSPLPRGVAAAEGFSPERLARIAPFMHSATEAPAYLGAVSLIARHGKVVDWQAWGHRDLSRQVPMAPDSIFRIYSMSKMVTSIALLMLIEEGRLALDDPVARHLPEFAALQVFAGGSAEAPRLRAPARALTVRHLLTHTTGFATGGAGFEQPTALLERAELHRSADLRDFAARVARVPLAADPGQRFQYDGVQIEVASRLVEVVSGLPFDTFLKRRLFDPLRMPDTGFEVVLDQRHRIVDITTTDAAGRLVAAPGLSPPGERLRPYFSGAGGLYSTAADYARLCQMVLGGGSLDGAQILGRKTVELMLMNHLTQTHPAPGLAATQFSASEGFGLGGSVVLDVARHGRLGSVGAFGWLGAASTYYTIDRQEQLIAILLLQHLPRDGAADLPKLAAPFYNLVYQALVH